MNRREKKIRYALRKLSQGLFSVAIGMVLVGPAISGSFVSADNISRVYTKSSDSIKIKVELIPKLYSELSLNEKRGLSKNLFNVPMTVDD